VALEDDIRTLSETPLLDELGRDALRLVAFSADHIHLQPGALLFREGDVAEASFVVVSGEIAFERAGVEKRVGRCALIGEIALVAETLRPATATAVGPAELIRITRGLFARLFEEYPELARKLHARIAARVEANIADLKRIEALLRK
jgi:CRP-like cAMP-binding protein